ncbi:MAG TPA: condensation domain-containing protein, partial [Pyrinomonadaceae bacterium]|nr:condensation domain-containing protein [Pyrinomonadaceae bacterium]
MSQTADRVTRFTAEQIKTLSLRLKQRQASRSSTNAPPIERADRTKRLPLSFAQQRLWFVDRLSGGSDTAYNVPLAVRLSGQLDISALASALSEVVR